MAGVINDDLIPYVCVSAWMYILAGTEMQKAI